MVVCHFEVARHMFHGTWFSYLPPGMKTGVRKNAGPISMKTRWFHGLQVAMITFQKCGSGPLNERIGPTTRQGTSELLRNDNLVSKTSLNKEQYENQYLKLAGVL